jgi:hypothetical protein
MTMLAELIRIADVMGLPVQTGVFERKQPNQYLVIVPMVDSFALYADDYPQYNESEVRLSLYTKGNYTTLADTLVHRLLENDFTITNRSYIEYDSGYYHYEIDVTKTYPFE